jgi:DNA-binding response OmpR family regulator
VLLDLHLPPHASSPREGYRTYLRIRELDARVPVVVVTSNDDSEVREALFRMGVKRLLVKPVSVEELSSTVQALLEQRMEEKQRC